MPAYRMLLRESLPAIPSTQCMRNFYANFAMVADCVEVNGNNTPPPWYAVLLAQR